MDEQVKPKAPLSMKSLQERIASLEKYAADLAAKLSQLELKQGQLYEAHQQLQQDFEAYKNIHPIKKLLKKKQKK